MPNITYMILCGCRLEWNWYRGVPITRLISQNLVIMYTTQFAFEGDYGMSSVSSTSDMHDIFVVVVSYTRLCHIGPCHRVQDTLKITYANPDACSNNRVCKHDDVIKWKHFPRYWPFVRGIHRSPVNSPHKGQWRGALMCSLIYVWINGWVNNREAGDLRHHRPHYDVAVMKMLLMWANVAMHTAYIVPMLIFYITIECMVWFQPL